MKGCVHEEAVRRAKGRLDGELARHVEECAECRQTSEVAAFLGQAAGGLRPRLPNASQLWWRAEIVRRLTAEDPRARKAMRPLAWGRRAAAVLVVAAFLVFAGLQASLLGSLPARLEALGGFGPWFVLVVALVAAPLVAAAAVFLLEQDLGTD